MITWNRTENTLHGQEIEVFRDEVSIGTLWVGQEATDEEVEVRVTAWVEGR